MATRLHMLSANAPAPAAGYASGDQDTKLNGSTGSFFSGRLSLTVGTGANTSSGVNTVTGPTNGLEVTTEWYSDPIDAAVTISGSITWNLWGWESSMSANAAINGQLHVLDCVTGVATLIDTTSRTIELGLGASGADATVNNFSETPASGVACKRGDRLRVRVFMDDAGTMASGFTANFTYNTNAASAGESWIELTENISFPAEPMGTTVYLTNDVSPVATAAVDRIAWTTRGSGVQTDVTNGVVGFTAPIQVTDTAGGTVVDWWTNTLPAMTLGGAVRVNLRASESNVANNMLCRCQIAVTSSTGTSPVVWAEGAYGREFGGTSEETLSFLIGGDDVAVTAGQRLRIRFFIDDAGVAMAVGTSTLYYAGAAGATGDSYLTFAKDLLSGQDARPAKGRHHHQLLSG